MILLADSGSTKADWCVVNCGQLVKQVFTKGANPFFRTQDEISEELGVALLPEISSYPIEAVYFYGAGCAFPDKNEIVEKAIRTHLNVPTVEVGSDLLAAARGLCGRNAGIACILGTGSNSCYYDGSGIRENISPLGYVLGDEGSGAVLGRLLVGACLKNQLTLGLKEKFLSQFDLTPQLILERVYRQPLANRFLASLSPFLLQHIGDESVYELVSGAFTLFFKRNVMQYDYRRHTVHLTGSVAWYYRKALQKVAAGLDITLGNITQSPMQGLMDYYK
ncbi:MAG: ATPase [Prevotellaceae bacterium]|jgi:N-acetylglucosamine kinase-like BadF-type ATPase|nr:ATPase [Prevotellaceae bacterium]